MACVCPYGVCGAERFRNIVKKYDNIRAVVFVIEFVAYKCVTSAEIANQRICPIHVKGMNKISFRKQHTNSNNNNK